MTVSSSGFLRRLGEEVDDRTNLRILQSHSVERLFHKGRNDICCEFLESCSESCGCEVATLWSFDPPRRSLILVQVNGAPISDFPESILNTDDCLSGETVERQRPTIFNDIFAPRGNRNCSGLNVLRKLGVSRLLSIPLLNSYNPNQVLMVLNLFYKQDENFPGEPSTERTIWENNLAMLARVWARRFEAWLYDRRLHFSNRLAIEFSKTTIQNEKQLCKNLARAARDALDCSSVAVYLESDGERRLELRSAVGNVWPHDKTKNVAGGPIEKCWADNREDLSLNILMEKGVIGLPIPGDSSRLTGAYFPLRDYTGKSRGVLRCVNECTKTHLRPFTYEDLAIVEGISQAFAAQLMILWADRRRLANLTHFGHEVGMPLAAFRAAVERVQMECKAKRVEFGFDYFQDIQLYIDILNRQLRQLDLMRGPSSLLALEIERTLLFREIVVPAIKSVEHLLIKRKLPTGKIIYKGLEIIPALYVDRALMTQVVFNLLANAIKYFQGNRNDFLVEIEAAEIEADESTTGYDLTFRDYGIGIPEEFKDHVFDYGVRAPNARQCDIQGHGIGLWISHSIVRRHDGQLTVRNSSSPTEIVLSLPHYLAYRAPNPQSEDDL
jgi:signal transduction histidine kinase